MKVGLGSVAIGVVAALTVTLAGCEDGARPLIAGVDGPHDLAITDGLLFVTATDDNELRVVDLTRERPDWVRGPNPLHPLSIPVAVRPVELAQDVLWENGVAAGGRFVYARSANGREISVVTADRDLEVGLRELPVRVALAEGEGSITALAARTLPGAAESTLYFAVFRGGESTIVGQPIGHDGTIDPAARSVVHGPIPCAAIQSLLVMPQANELAYSLRRPRNAIDQEGCTGAGTEEERLERLDTLVRETVFVLDTDAGTTTLLEFGAPIRRLYTHGDYSGLGERVQRVWGLIDSDACRGRGCRGALAVDWGADRSGARVQIEGRPMRPIHPGTAVPMGLALGEEASLQGVPGTSLLGAIPAADGRIYFFDAADAQPYDVDPEPASVVTTGEGEARVVEVQRLFPERGGDVTAATVQEGAARNEEIALTYLGALPGFVDLPGPQAPASEVRVSEDPTGVVELGDLVHPSAACGVTDPIAISGIASRSVLGGRLTTDAAFGGPGCTFTVRVPEGAAPWTVVGTGSGYLGRVGAGTGLEVPSEERRLAFYEYLPRGLGETLPPVLRFDFVAPDVSGAGPETGVQLRIRTRSAFRLASATLEARTATNLRLDVAGAAQFHRPASDGVPRLVVTYPSSDLVLQVYPREIAPDAPISRYDLFQ